MKKEIKNGEIHLGDCLEVLKNFPAASVDSIVTDPPYGLSFMGKRWDYDVPSEEIWRECLRVLKPGGHLLAFAGTRTQHRMAVRIEDAGFEIRDMIAWVYGSGFPKSMDVSKALDKMAGNEIKGEGSFFTLSGGKSNGGSKFRSDHPEYQPYAPVTEAARQWSGWGTALKPALEPITVARKPLIGTVAENVLAHGTGALNVDGCRVGTEEMGGYEESAGGMFQPSKQREAGYRPKWDREDRPFIAKSATGRWPANLIHDGSEEVVGLFPATHARGNVRASVSGSGTGFIGGRNQSGGEYSRADSGSAARFFYCAKASKRDRDEGNNHPTVKPTDLMRYLCRLVTPPGGIVLDPFMGSGSTGKAARLEGFRFIGIERDEGYVEIAENRINNVNTDLFSDQ